jgi:lipopolysaccharide transport system ATP-binding protein
VGNTFTAETLSIAAGATAGYDLDLANTDLAPGKYFCGVSIGTGNHETSIKDFDIVLEVLHFEVVPPSGAPVGTWNPNWGAVCFPTPVVKHCGENGRGK